jgi:hypothetical protein
MKTRLSILFALWALTGLGADFTLGWDPSPSPGVTNYVLYASTNGLSASTLTNAMVAVNVGTNTLMEAQNIVPGTWSFAVTAQAGGIESGPSNILIVQVPAAPANLRSVIIQFPGSNIVLTNLPYFRLLIQ